MKANTVVCVQQTGRWGRRPTQVLGEMSCTQGPPERPPHTLARNLGGTRLQAPAYASTHRPGRALRHTLQKQSADLLSLSPLGVRGAERGQVQAQTTAPTFPAKTLVLSPSCPCQKDQTTSPAPVSSDTRHLWEGGGGQTGSQVSQAGLELPEPPASTPRAGYRNMPPYLASVVLGTESRARCMVSCIPIP